MKLSNIIEYKDGALVAEPYTHWFDVPDELQDDNTELYDENDFEDYDAEDTSFRDALERGRQEIPIENEPFKSKFDDPFDLSFDTADEGAYHDYDPGDPFQEKRNLSKTHPEKAQELPVELQSELYKLSVAGLIDYGWADETKPFLITPSDKLLVGETDRYHESISGRFDSSEYEKYPQNDIVYGRVGYNVMVPVYEGEIQPGYSAMPGSTTYIVPEYLAFMLATDSDFERIQPVIEKFREENIISDNALISAGGRVWRADEGMPGGGVVANAAESERLSRMLHLGKDENGKAISPQMKKKIRQKLGLPDGGKANKWQQALQDKKLSVPGRKLWAMHSESI